MEGGANVEGVNNDVGEGGSPVVTNPSAESGAGATVAATGGEDDSPVPEGVVGDGTSPSQTVHMARRSRSRLSRRKLGSKRKGRGFGK